ncbi:hypothetical protein [Lacticaseibacillus mingshuiensis]
MSEALMMKKMVVIGLVILGVGTASGLGVQAHIDQASAGRTTVVARTAKTAPLGKPTASAKPKTGSAVHPSATTQKKAVAVGEQTVAKKTQATTASRQSVNSTPVTQKAQTKTAAPATSSTTKATTTKKNVTATTTQTTASPAASQQSALSNYNGTWHNAAVTVTLTATTMTVTQNGQALTSRYQAQAAGDGFIFTPLDHEADALYLVLANGHLEWTTGASAPLVLTK